MRGLSVAVKIGGQLLPSLNSAALGAERRIGQMGRKLKVTAAEMRLASRDMAGSLKSLGALAGAGGLSFSFKNTITGGASFMHEVAALQVAGRTTQEVTKAIDQAKRTALNVPTSTLNDNLRVLRETVGAYGDLGHALHNLDFNQRMGFMMSSMAGMDRETASHSLVAGIQALEIRGAAMDEKRYQREMNELFKATAFFAGKEGAFTPESLRAFAKTGNLPLKMYSERFMTKILPALITEVGSGDIIGTQSSAFNNWINGQTGTGNKSKTEFAQRLGLVSATDTSQLTKTGWKPGAVLGTSLAKSDPLAWIDTILLPRLEKAGFNIKDTKSLELGVSSLFGRETAKRFVMSMADPLQRTRLRKDEDNIEKAMSPEEGYAFLLKHDPQVVWAKVLSRIDNLATTLGEKVFTPKFISAIDRLAGGIEWFAGAMDRHPNVAKGIIGGMGAGALGLGAMALGVGGGFIARMGGGLLTMIGGLITRAGPVLLNGLTRLAPFVIRGLAMAFALLATPAGWAVILAGCAAALVYYFRNDIAKWWNTTFMPAWRSFWDATEQDVLNRNWGAIGTRIGDLMTNGFVSAIKRGDWGGAIHSINTSWAMKLLNPSLAAGQEQAGRAAQIAGKRARGGPVLAGRTYLVGERGPELFRPTFSGSIIPNHKLANDNLPRRALSAMAATGLALSSPAAAQATRPNSLPPIAIHIHGVQDANGVEAAVERALRRLLGESHRRLSDG